MRVQNEGTGKSSWWQINPEAKPGIKFEFTIQIYKNICGLL